ncbi:hypothetical protein [Kitasatospora sp. NPDC101183]|uniref:hypothetical protein n=1 Tax=Kitasatospora sp. NPDC101183 TaxID=3364100 RepID=UPI003807A481
MFKPSLKSSITTVFVATLLLAGTAACGHPSAPGPTALEPAATAADATAAGGSPAAVAPGATGPRARAGSAGSPGSAGSAAGRPPAAEKSGTVAVAPAGEQRAAIGSPGKDGAAVTPTAANLQLTGYDAGAGTAVLTGSGDATAARPGQLLASPPTSAAPQGALLAVTGVKPGAARDSLALTTRPATLPELLGATEADGQVPVDPHGITVTPLVKDLKATVGADGPGGVKADASGTLEVVLSAPVPLPDGLSLEATGSLQLHPAVHFAYHGAAASSPRTASVGFDLGAHAHWKVTGDAKRGTGAAPVRVPFAKLQASPVLTVAGLPVVVNLGLTCYLEVGADGQVHLEAEQDAAGTWAVRADYTGGKGWTPTTSADTKVTPVQLRLTGRAAVRAALGVDVSLGLYDTVGVEAGVAPYVSARAEGSLVADSSGKAPQVQGSWSLVGGVDLNGSLLAHLKIFGTPVIEGRLPLPPYHREWPLLGASPTPTAS